MSKPASHLLLDRARARFRGTSLLPFVAFDPGALGNAAALFHQLHAQWRELVLARFPRSSVALETSRTKLLETGRARSPRKGTT